MWSRENNEDSHRVLAAVGLPKPAKHWQRMAVLALMVGSAARAMAKSPEGMVAETAIAIFKEAKPETPASDIMRQIYDEAAAKIYQAGRKAGPHPSPRLSLPCFARR